MLQDFKKEEILEKMRKLERREDELKQIEKELKEAIRLRSQNEDHRLSLEGKKEYALTVKSKSNIFSKIASLLLHRGKYYEINKQININIEELQLLEEEQQRIEARITDLQEIQSNLKQENIVLPKCVQQYDGTLVITEEALGEEEKERVKNIDAIPSDKKVLVHYKNRRQHQWKRKKFHRLLLAVCRDISDILVI